MTIAQDVRLANPTGLVELFVLDTTVLGAPQVQRFHSGTINDGDIVWQGNTYFHYPIFASGFQMDGQGRLPRPRMQVANVTQAISVLCRTYDDLIGAKVIRRRTFVKYLDAVNFPNGNDLADPNAHFPDDIFFINRKVSESKVMVEFELVAALELNMKIPRRQVVANSCPWQYRGPECGYTGGPVATIMDVPTADPDLDRCGKRLESCKLRFGSTSELPFGGVPTAGLYQ